MGCGSVACFVECRRPQKDFRVHPCAGISTQKIFSLGFRMSLGFDRAYIGLGTNETGFWEDGVRLKTKHHWWYTVALRIASSSQSETLKPQTLNHEP